MSENSQNPIQVTGKQLLSNLASEIKNLCFSVDDWLSRQNEIIDRVERIEKDIQELKSRL
jgi:hypothetical protein